jgi:hypothetical protein
MKKILLAASLLILVGWSTKAQTSKNANDKTADKGIDLGELISTLASFKDMSVSTNSSNTNDVFQLRTNDVFQIRLQKDKDKRGISVDSFAGTVNTSEDAFSPTPGKITLTNLLFLVANSAVNGRKPQHSISFVSKLDKNKGGFSTGVQFCLLGIYVSPSAATSSIPVEIRKRFGLSPPYDLDFCLDGERVLVDLAHMPAESRRKK